MWQSVGLTLLVIVATLVCALLFMLFGEFKENNLYRVRTSVVYCLIYAAITKPVDLGDVSEGHNTRLKKLTVTFIRKGRTAPLELIYVCPECVWLRSFHYSKEMLFISCAEDCRTSRSTAMAAPCSLSPDMVPIHKHSYLNLELFRVQRFEASYKTSWVQRNTWDKKAGWPCCNEWHCDSCLHWLADGLVKVKLNAHQHTLCSK